MLPGPFFNEMIVYCKKCGAQNFIGKERLLRRETSPPSCWKCFSPLVIEGETEGEDNESNKCFHQTRIVEG